MLLNELILATKNQHKADEMRSLLKPLGISVFSSIDFPNLPDVIEDGQTLEANALKKAKTIAKLTGKPTLADDTGLFVDVLNGAPGVYSARFAGGNASYEDNVVKLLTELTKKGSFPHSARFETVLALVIQEKEVLLKGVCEGKIIDVRKGGKGFGYDPIFIPNGYSETFAEISSEEKNRISHRGKAIQLFIKYLKES